MSSTLRYGTNTQNTSQHLNDMLNEFIKMPRGVFNETRRKIIEMNDFSIIPIECFEMLPNSEAYLSYDVSVINKNPTVKRIMSGSKIELRTYKINYSDCWEGWNNFITKGRTGKVTKSIPYVDLSLNSNDVTTSLPYSVMEYLNHAPSVFLAEDTGGKKFTFEYNTKVQPLTSLQSSGKTGISTLAGLKASTAMRINALPYVMYNKIVKKYQNPNLLQNNPHWYPENEEHDLILPYEATGAVTTSDFDNPTKAFVNGTSIIEPSATKDENEEYQSYPWLNVIYNAQRKGDFYNTGSPFPDLIRGDVPTLDAIQAQLRDDTIDQINNVSFFKNVPRDLSNLFVSAPPVGEYDSTPSYVLSQNGQLHGFGTKDQQVNDLYRNFLASQLSINESDLNECLSQPTFKLHDRTVESVNISLKQWRYLATMTILKERLALTDGSYNKMIEAMFGHNPRFHMHDVTYCGGMTQDIVFTEVVNTNGDGTSPLGDTGGRAVSYQNGNLIKVRSDDYGLFMTVAVITPDSYLSQGVDKMFSRLENSEQYIPILNNLSPDSIRNKELYVSGTNTTDNDVFNYQEQFYYYRSRQNKVCNLLSLAISKIGDVGAYLSHRIFADTPNFNHEFNSGNLTENEKAIYTSTNQAPYIAVIGCNMRYIAPIPENSRPSNMGISY